MRARFSVSFLFVIVFSVVMALSAFGSKVKGEYPIGLDVLRNIEMLPLLNDGVVCMQHSSYDRTGGNDDGFSGRYTHLRQTDAREYVIFDAEGPGCIYRLWSAKPPEGYVKFYFDDEETPRLECNFMEMFQDMVAPFASPLTGTSSGGWYSYHPIPFARRCTIVTENTTGFLAIAYHKFPEDAKVETFSVTLTQEQKDKYDEVQKHYSDPAKREVEAGLEMKWSKVPAGESNYELAKLRGPGTVLGFHMKIKTDEKEKWEDDHTLRQVVLRIYWDGESSPAIECPVGDFFGTGFGDKQPVNNVPAPLTYSAVPFGMTEDFYYFRLPMPFRKSARITVENGTGREVEVGWAVDFKKDKVPENAAYLHVQWREHMTKEGEHVPILSTTGRGKYVGTLLSMQSPWWLTYLEGDEKIYVDGEERPGIHGTGTEDYFNCGWYYADGPVARPFHGITVKRDPQSRTSQYRMHVPDNVPFRKSLKVEIEHGESNNKPYTDYAIVAYWYQDSTSHRKDFVFPPASELRLPGTLLNDPEGTWVRFGDLASTLDVEAGLQAEGDKVGMVPLDKLDESFKGAPRLLVSGENAGASLRFEYICARDDLYSIELVGMKGVHFGIAEVFVDGESMGQKVDFYTPRFHQAHIRLPESVFMSAGKHWIELRLTGKNENSDGYSMALAGYNVSAASEWPKEWNMIGAFTGGRDNGYSAAYPPEDGIDLNAKYKGATGKEIGWIKDKANTSVWIHEKLSPNVDCVAYAHTYVWSPDERLADALISTDDGGKLFVNGELVFGIPGMNHLKVDEYSVPVTLQEGWNEVLIKVCQGGGHWGFAFRINDPRKELFYSTTKEKPEEKAEK